MGSLPRRPRHCQVPRQAGNLLPRHLRSRFQVLPQVRALYGVSPPLRHAPTAHAGPHEGHHPAHRQRRRSPQPRHHPALSRDALCPTPNRRRAPPLAGGLPHRRRHPHPHLHCQKGTPPADNGHLLRQPHASLLGLWQLPLPRPRPLPTLQPVRPPKPQPFRRRRPNDGFAPPARSAFHPRSRRRRLHRQRRRWHRRFGRHLRLGHRFVFRRARRKAPAHGLLARLLQPSSPKYLAG
mmetsp:Transcript_19184/g.47091  ORF Transcript_19184/g.47091 Transcript_19184/m.47091 type:complete len:237 (+) Transcript_19184:553-1263(+)